MIFRKIIDVSRKIKPGMETWPGDKEFGIVRDSSVASGDLSNTSHITMGLHAGTHIDTPLHFIDGGEDVSTVDLSSFIGTVKIYELEVEKCITEDDIKDLSIARDDVIFFKTSNSDIPEDAPFLPNYVYLDEAAAKHLVEKRIKTVGIDYLSIENYYSTDCPVHKLLLSNNISIVEGLMLKEVDAGQYFYSCLPLRIEGGEGSPVRAILAHF